MNGPVRCEPARGQTPHRVWRRATGTQQCLVVTPVPSRVAALGDELVRIHDTLRTHLSHLRSGGTHPGRSLTAHCLSFCEALTRHHTGEDAGAFPALTAQFPDLRPLLDKMTEDHAPISGIVTWVEAIARDLADGSSPRLTAELDGLSAIMESHFSFEERRIRDALDALDGTASELLGA